MIAAGVAMYHVHDREQATLRALADDYGALVFIDFGGRENGVDRLSVRLLEADFAEGRGFDLAERAAG